MLFTSFTYHCYSALLIRSTSVPLWRGYRRKKKQRQAQAKRLRQISNLSSHLHGSGHVPVLALWADPSSYAGENKNVQSDLEWYLSCWIFFPCQYNTITRQGRTKCLPAIFWLLWKSCHPPGAWPSSRSKYSLSKLTEVFCSYKPARPRLQAPAGSPIKKWKSAS